MRSIRYNASQLTEFVRSDTHEIFIVRLKDKFGDHGVVGLFIIEFDEENKFCFIDTFLMSCRILEEDLKIIVLNIFSI